MEAIPITYQEITDKLKIGNNPFALRVQTILAIEKITNIPLVCYISKTSNIPKGVSVSIDEDDLVGFSDLISGISGDQIDVFIISNGGSPEAAERLIKLLRNKYKQVRFIVTGNAYSAATMMCFAADGIIMHRQGTLGPIDPQIGGIPAHAILESFEEIEKRIKDEGPLSLTVYMPLLSKYDLHLLNLCRKAQALSIELASQYLKQYMKIENDDLIVDITKFFMDHETHKSHGRSIDRETAKGKGLKVIFSEDIGEKTEKSTYTFNDLLLSLFNQYQLFFTVSPLFYKLFENAKGINWGRAVQPQQIQMAIPISNIPQFPKV